MTDWIALKDVAVRPHHGRAAALVEGGVRDHAAFRADAAQWRSAFATRSGERWALYFNDASEFSAALFGAWHAGKAVYLCADTLPETLTRLTSEVDGFAGDFPADWPVVSVSSGARAAPDDETDWPALDEEATRLVVYTSGSTGAPTAIDKRLAQLAREVESLQVAFGRQVDATVVHGTVSHQHIYGLLFRVLWPLAAGRVIAPRLHFHEEIVAALQSPSVLVSSPAHLKRIPEGLDWSAARRHLRAVFSSGGPLPEGAALSVHAVWGLAPIEVFGSSETGGIAWRQCTHGQSPWTPLPGVTWRIVDGQLELASPYLFDPGWWRSSDRAQAEGSAGFRLLGRADRIVKVEERRVSLTALERQLADLPEVAEARVLLIEGARTELAAVVVPSPDGSERLREQGRRAFAQSLNAALAPAQDAVTRPRRWRFVAALPRDAQGKTTESALRTLFRPLRPVPVWVLREPTEAQLDLTLDPTLAVFDGHFPQMPILPGVAQLDWAVRFGREAFPLPAHVLRVEALKFQQVARPGSRIRLHLEWQAETHRLVFRYESDHGVCASGRVVFAEAGA